MHKIDKFIVAIATAFVSVIAVLMSPAMAHAQTPSLVVYPSADGSQIKAYLYLAVGREEKSPTIIALHGCGGPMNRTGSKLSSRHRTWAKVLINAGYHVLFPDSFGSRGHGSLCRVKPRPVRQRDRIADVEGTLAWLKQQSFVEHRAISVLGWSNGGGTALRVAIRPFARDLRHVIAFYPGCTRLAQSTSARSPQARLKIIMGASDDWTPAAPCKVLAGKWRAPIVLYDGAYHSFDSPSRTPATLSGLAFSAKNNGIAHVSSHFGARRKAIAEVLGTLASQ